jgi:uncharacterized protein involved in exopolysaccharide biosynthesis
MRNLMSKATTLLILAGMLLTATCITIFFLPTPAVIEAKILVIKNGNPPPNAMDKEADDYVATHLILLRSPMMAERAIKKNDLGALKSLAKANDPISQFLAGLGVVRDPADGAANVLTLTYRGASPDDGAKILNALIDSYQDLLSVGFSVQILNAPTKKN